MEDYRPGKQEMLEEIGDLLSIPQLERIIFHKIAELKFLFKDEVDRYKELKESFKRAAYGEIQVVEPVEAGAETERKTQTYHFEIDIDSNNEWTATSLEPSPPPGYEIHDIIPDEIVKYIVSFKTAPGKIETQKEISFPAIEGKVFDLSFVKYSDRHILGTINASHAPSKDGKEDKPLDDLTDIYYYNQAKDDEGNFKDLIYYMQKYPSVKHYFLTELNMKMKPLILGKLIDITSSSRPVDRF